MNLEVGKRYVTRNGSVTSKLQYHSAINNCFEGRIAGERIEWYNDGVVLEPYLSGYVIEQEYHHTQDRTLSPEKPAATPKTDKSNTGLVLIPFHSLFRLGAIFIEGLRYGKDNWKKGINDKEYQEERLEHALVHIAKWKEGDRTEDHLAKVAWFCFTQMELERLESLHVSVSNDSTN